MERGCDWIDIIGVIPTCKLNKEFSRGGVLESFNDNKYLVNGWSHFPFSFPFCGSRVTK